MPIPDEAINALARHLCERNLPPEWRTDERWTRMLEARAADDYRDMARTYLEVALPHLEINAEQRVWRAENVLRGHCRWCHVPVDPGIRGYPMPHRMYCKLYVGPLEHHWVRTAYNQTFGGIDYFCSCSGWFRKGGSAGHGDGTPDAEPLCPHTGEDWRGPRPDEEDEHEVIAGPVTRGDLESIAQATGGYAKNKNLIVEYDDDDD